MGKWKQAMLDTAEFVDTMIGAPPEEGSAPDGTWSVGATIRLGVARYVEKTEARFAELSELHKKDLERLQQSSSVSFNSIALQLRMANIRVQHLEARLNDLNLQLCHETEQADLTRDVSAEHTQARRLLRDALGYKDREVGGDEPGLVGLVEEVIALARRVLGGGGEISAAIGRCDVLFDGDVGYPSRTRVREDAPTVETYVDRAIADACPSPCEAVYLRDIYKLIHAADVGYPGDSVEVKALLETRGFVWWPWAPECSGRRYIKRSELTPGDWSRIVLWFLDAHSYPSRFARCDLVDASAAYDCFVETYGFEKYEDCPLWSAAMRDQSVWEYVESLCTWTRKHA